VGLQAPIAGAMGQRVGEKRKDWSTLPRYMLYAGIFGLLGVVTRHLDVTRAVGIAVLALGAYLIEK